MQRNKDSLAIRGIDDAIAADRLDSSQPDRPLDRGRWISRYTLPTQDSSSGSPTTSTRIRALLAIGADVVSLN